MKRKFFLVIVLCVGIQVLSIAGFAQTDGSKSDEVVRLTGKAERRLDAISFRMTLKTEWFTERDGELFRESTETLATALPDRYQSTSDVRGTRIETIVVGDKTFRRTNDSDWESVAVPPLRRAGDAATVARFGDLAGGATLPGGSGKFVAKGTIDGQEVSMYEIRSLLQDRSAEGAIRSEITKYWINSEGLVVRRVIEHEFGGDKRFMRSTANYTYTNIRIEEPILPVTVQD